MRWASPKPCWGPMVSRVRKTIRSRVPWRIPRSLVDIQKEYGTLPLGCQEESAPGFLADRPGGVLADLPVPRRGPAGHTSDMATQLAALSNEIAAAVAQAARNVVAVHARPRFSSSGVFWRPGVIVTAEHTIRREEDITVTLPDGTKVPATLAGTDTGTDIAVLKIEAAQQTPGPTIAAPAPGTLALAIGRSEDSGPNATLGIISASSGEWRTWRGGRLEHYLRLDLTVYPGSDGGAVINTQGETIGIATSALSRIAGLAIPAVTLDRVVEEILKRGHVARGYLGVGLQPVELPDHHRGLIVLSLEPKGPAAKAGIMIGDILVQLGGKPVQDTDDIQLALEGRAVGQTVAVDIVRGGESRQIAVSIAERPRSN